MGFQVRGCGFISVTTVEGTFVTTAVQPQVVVFAVLIANPTTPRKITSVTEARTNHGYTRLYAMIAQGWKSYNLGLVDEKEGGAFRQ